MKNAVIIGASSGIGREIALQLLREGYHVTITGRRTSLLEEVRREFPSTCREYTFDITDLKRCDEVMSDITGQPGGIDLLLISSGTGEINESLDFALELPTLQTNILGFTAIADRAFNYFQSRGSGHLAAITSVAGARGSRGAPAYSASKAFQINYLESLSQKASNLKLPICITDIRPGFVETAMAKGEGQFWVSTPQKAASRIIRAIKKRKRVVYVTRRWKIIYLLLKWLPDFLFRKL